IMATAMLNAAGMKARYVGGSDDFEVGKLRELRAFRKRMTKEHPGIGLIPKETWEKVKLEFLDGLAGHPLQADIEDLLELYETSSTGRHDLAEWNTFVREIRISDAVRPEKGVVMVSTMHKSKGKEFNNVFIHLEGHVLDTDEARRLLYVACTRAMDSLEIHTNTHVLTDYQGPALERVVNADEHSPPATIEYVLGMKEVYLGSCAYASERIKRLGTGDELRPDTVQFSNNRAPGLGTPQGNVLLYSRKFVGGALGRFERNGYSVARGRVEYIVEWYDREKDKTYEVVLPRLSLQRSEAAN
ncbi:MAG: ATP-dependent helicase, partial [Flavobacteriales bacterium]|nr:ATP-dependent helicase [Flavobacteriales bacterium]